MEAKQVVLTSAAQLFGEKDPLAVDRWVSPGYVQHSSMAADGPDGLRDLIQGLPDGFRYDMHRIIADGDLVALHGTYYGWGPDPLVAFDVFRVADGKRVEHWDALTPVVPKTASGRSQTDGPTEVTDLASTEANRDLVVGFIETVFKDGRAGAIGNFISTDEYLQHSPGIADGIGELSATLEKLGSGLAYDKVHLVVAEGNFVLTAGEGTFGGKPTAFYDLYRVENGKIVEHWDSTPEIRNDLPHANGAF
ncbi:putative SnoaL-like aldol condensation-catalyzing enzyme [Asanoa ferruginea]|uniref:Putative SnoaL-like aldol condensation-catalyzing enzyme n=1 Tax=Asanoa ferruginea TaxID=53367 RepID=A0A3D9ZVK2_9ACTN|nr:nuclear transport factor 2 family protein [Asanoa ferruginea]REG01212.1 putative SnoaL-like aldol condensation-catalyzing enzyme [Asanoa ferruginea]GIF47078.1 polyketide cyclase [Asanoa ferruginea]